MNGAKVLMIGLEAMEPRLVEQWTAAGYLPNFKMLMEQGSYRHLDTPALLAGFGLPALNIGKPPQSTGLYYHLQWDAKAMRIVRRDQEWADLPYFWTRLGQHGKRVVVIDAGLAGLQQQPNGIQIAGWQSDEVSRRPESSPPELIKEVIARFGRVPLGFHDPVQGRPGRQAVIRDRLLLGVHNRTRLLVHFLQNEPWDFFFGNYAEGHRAGHQIWGFPENGGRVHQETAEEPGTALREIYQALDASLGSLLAAAPPDAYVLVFSHCGMGPARESPHLLGPLLEKLDAVLDGRRQSQASDGAPANSCRLLRSLIAALPTLVLTGVAQALPLTLRDRVRSRLMIGGLDWSRTRFFNVPTDGLGYIRFNLWGREALGIVRPGRELEKLIQEVTNELMQWIDIRTNLPIVSKVWRTAEVFSGPHTMELPDLLVDWGEPLPTDRSRSPRAGLLEGREPEPRGGQHRLEGILLARSAGIPRGACMSNAHLLDIPPTVFRLLGLPPQDSLEGRPIGDVVAALEQSSQEA